MDTDALLESQDESDASMRARLVESLSNSFPGSALSRALHAMDEDQDKDQLSQSCFAEIRVDKIKIEPESDDEELTSLAWLQDGNLLKNLSSGDGSSLYSPIDSQKENSGGFDLNRALGNPHPPHVPYNPQKHVNSKPPYSFSCLIFMAIEDSPCKKLPVKDIYNWILTHFPYFQNAPTGWKNSVRHNLSLNKCFKKVEKEKGSSIGKGSLWCIDPDYRPNLLQALRKTPYHPYHQLQILNNITPFNNTAGYTLLSSGNRALPLAPHYNVNSPSPHLFPFLSKRLAQSKFDAADSDIDVANTLVSLKRAAESRRPLQCRNGWSGGARSRSPSPPEFGSEREKQMLKRRMRASRPKSPVVVTSYPSDDHTYSVPEPHSGSSGAHSPASSIDEAYEFGGAGVSTSDVEDISGPGSDYADDCSDEENMQTQNGADLKLAKGLASPFKKRLMAAHDADEEMKIVEGADALLNLAGFMSLSMPKIRSLSPHNNNNNNNNEAGKVTQIKSEPVEDGSKDNSSSSSSSSAAVQGESTGMEVDEIKKEQEDGSTSAGAGVADEDMETDETSQP